MLTHSFQRSKEKNLAWEDTRRRNEASMARKRANAKAINPAAANSSLSPTDGPLSPSSTGAMDSLLEKLRAAAPQARDQRDRRRRARLKDRHQVRVASGQTIPDMGDLTQNADGEDEDVARKLLDPSAAAVAGGGITSTPFLKARISPIALLRCLKAYVKTAMGANLATVLLAGVRALIAAVGVSV